MKIGPVVVIIFIIIAVVMISDPLRVHLTRCRKCSRFVFARDAYDESARQKKPMQTVNCKCGESYTREAPYLSPSD